MQREVARQLEGLSRDDIIITALAGQGGIVLTADLAEAAALADAFAPEHLCLATAEPRAMAEDVYKRQFLLLDEPINHLDIPSRTRFEEALTGFPGTILAVVHDRYFIERFATDLWRVEDGRVTWEPLVVAA